MMREAVSVLRSAGVALTAAACIGGSAAPASAEPTFLSKQYPRCTACHYSASGGGLLTPYGRSLSREEISTFGRRGPSAAAGAAVRGEEGFLFGALPSDSPLQLGLDARPSHLAVEAGGRALPDRNFLMNLDVQAAWRQDRWTVYGTAGRAPDRGGAEFVSYEHWVAWQATERVTVRGGRFLPAYGVRFADHTSFTRAWRNLAEDDQIYGVEVGVSTDRTLLQVALGPGRAASLLDGDGREAITASGRFQLDLGPRTVVAGSVLHRARSDAAPRSTDTGLSLGYAPAAWLTTWTHADVRFQRLPGSRRSYIFANQTSVEALRGVWIRVSPQTRWIDADPRGEVRRMAYGLDLYPRTHWHVNLSYYRDHLPFVGRRTRTFLAQLHLYL
ncbi:MAG: hypothetical protein OXF93_01435 [Acidobacteria bacterium]|nr:hypothetical protein [Acidobacteriota bacterium]